MRSTSFGGRPPCVLEPKHHLSSWADLLAISTSKPSNRVGHTIFQPMVEVLGLQQCFWQLLQMAFGKRTWWWWWWWCGDRQSRNLSACETRRANKTRHVTALVTSRRARHTLPCKRRNATFDHDTHTHTPYQSQPYLVQAGFSYF